ncbi:thiamine-binding protein, partial [Acinetobacter baumannii]
GSYKEVMKLIEDINEYLYQQACEEWIVNCQIQFRAGSDITIEEKTNKY